MHDDRAPEAVPDQRQRWQPHPALPRPLVLVATVAVLALLTAGWFGWSWCNATEGTQGRIQRAREAAVAAGGQELVTFSTLDYQHVNQSLDRWAHSSTGPLLDGLNKSKTQDVQAIQHARMKSTGKIVSQALTRLDAPAGKAHMLGVVDVVLTPPQGHPVTKRTRLQADLTRTNAGWKLAGLGPVGAGV